MPKVLFIGGVADGGVFDLPQGFEANGGQTFSVAAQPPLRGKDAVVDAFGPLVPTRPAYGAYRVCRLHVVDCVGGQNHVTKLSFAHDVDTQPSEALVMLMQRYQNSGEDR